MDISNGTALFEKLSELRYPSIQKFTPSSFDWLFDNDEAVEFLNWFCQTVKGSNVLTASEIKRKDRFEKLKKEKVTILEGKRLTEAITGREKETVNELEEEINNLKRVKEQLLVKKQNCVKTLNLLNVKDKHISQDLQQYEEFVNSGKTSEDMAADKLLHANAALKDTMSKLLEVSRGFVQLFSKSMLLSQQSFDHFLTMEENYTKSLMDIATKQFDKNMGLMGQNCGPELCAFVDVEDPDLGKLLGLDENTRSIQNWELNNLQTRLPMAESDRITREVEVSAATASLKFWKQTLSSLNDANFLSTISSNHCVKTNELTIKNAALLKELLSLKKDTIKEIEKSTRIRCSSVIIGDCNLKLLRQEYCITNQKEFLSLMTQQWAREQLVNLALRNEESRIAGALSLLNGVARKLHDGNAAFASRLSIINQCLDNLKSSRERSTIASSDVFAQSLLAVLDEEHQSPGTSIRVYDDVVDLATKFAKESKSTLSAYQELQNQLIVERKNLEKTVASMEDLVFGGPVRSVTQPLARSEILEKEFSKLDIARDGVQNLLKPLHRDFKAKHSVLKNDHFLQLERRLWTLFYTDPSSMLRKTEALAATAKS